MVSNLVIIATHPANLANPDGDMAAMVIQDLGPTALTTVRGGEVPRDGLWLERGWRVYELLPNASTNCW